MLKAGQTPKSHPRFEVAALGVEEYPPRFLVAAAFANTLKEGDVVDFFTYGDNTSPLWAKTWRVAKVVKHTEDTRMVYVVEVTNAPSD